MGSMAREAHAPGGWVQACRYCGNHYWVSYIPSTGHTKKFELDKETPHPCFGDHNKAIVAEQSRMQGD